MRHLQEESTYGLRLQKKRCYNPDNDKPTRRIQKKKKSSLLRVKPSRVDISEEETLDCDLKGAQTPEQLPTPPKVEQLNLEVIPLIREMDGFVE